MKINGSDLSQYSVIVPNNETMLIAGLIEIPNFESASLKLASISRYVFTHDIFDILRN